jgi:hypothetical protein
VYLSDAGFLNEGQQPRIVCTYLIDSMAIVRHDESTTEAEEYLQYIINDSDFSCMLDKRCDGPDILEGMDMVQPSPSSALRHSTLVGPHRKPHIRDCGVSYPTRGSCP